MVRNTPPRPIATARSGSLASIATPLTWPPSGPVIVQYPGPATALPASIIAPSNSGTRFLIAIQSMCISLRTGIHWVQYGIACPYLPSGCPFRHVTDVTGGVSLAGIPTPSGLPHVEKHPRARDALPARDLEQHQLHPPPGVQPGVPEIGRASCRER